MSTIQETKDKVKQLKNDLARIEAETKTARAQLEKIASQDPEAAAKTAGVLMVLQARAEGLKQAIQTAEAEAARLTEFAKSKEYKDGQRKLAEFDTYFAQEADATHETIYKLLAHLRAVDEKQKEYAQLVDRVCIDLEDRQKIAKARNKDWRYMMAAYQALNELNIMLANGGLLTSDQKQLTHNSI